MNLELYRAGYLCPVSLSYNGDRLKLYPWVYTTWPSKKHLSVAAGVTVIAALAAYSEGDEFGYAQDED